MDRTTIAKIEKMQRQARVEELVAFAAALDVAPVNLFLPITDDQAEVRLAPNLAVNLRKAQRWARGTIPLRPVNFEFYVGQAPTSPALEPVSGEELSREQRQAFRDKRLREIAGLNEAEIINEVGAALYRSKSPGGPMELQPLVELDPGDAAAQNTDPEEES